MSQNAGYYFWSPGRNRTENRTCLKKSAITTSGARPHLPGRVCGGAEIVPQLWSSESGVWFSVHVAVVEFHCSSQPSELELELLFRVAWHVFRTADSLLPEWQTMWAEACNHAYRAN